MMLGGIRYWWFRRLGGPDWPWLYTLRMRGWRNSTWFACWHFFP